MKKLMMFAFVVAACGGKHTGTTTVVKNTAPPDAAVAPQTYGGEDYGDEYGDDEYGDEGYGGDEYGGGQAAAPTPPDVTGQWASDCVAGATASEFRTIAFDNTADKWDLHVATFGDDKCAKRKSDLHIAGAYTIGAASTTVTDAWEGTFSFATLELTADDAKTAKALGKLCGIKKMKAGKASDLSAKGCVALGVHPLAQCAADNDIVAVQSGKLRFGVRPADNDLCTTDKRPTALDTSVDLNWQWKPVGVADCDTIGGQYEKLLKCPKMPQQAIDAMVQGVKPMHDAFAQAAAAGGNAAQQIAETCKQVTAQLAQALTQTGC
jgi:hypothetical protein